LFDTDDVGKQKALEAAQRLKALNPGIKIEAYDAELNAENAAQLFLSMILSRRHG
jgi:molybdopterin/thiamine biosynthesis adenylyltransferase